MNLKNQSSGFYTSAVAAVLAIIGVIAYNVNCGTAYYITKGTNPLITVCGLAAAVILVVAVVLAQKGTNVVVDALVVVAPVLMMVAAILMIGLRVGDIASVMTFENNASTMADTTSALVAIVCLFLSTVVSLVASFQEISK